MIAEVLDVLSQKGAEEDALVEAAVRDKVKALVGPLSRSIRGSRMGESGPCAVRVAAASTPR